MYAAPTLLWFRRDLRIDDHPGWPAALAAGGPVIPVFILDPLIERSLGAASLWRLGEGLRVFADRLGRRGSRLVLRRGDAGSMLRQLVSETGARRVVWSRLYDAPAIERDSAIKAALRAEGIDAVSVNSSLLFEPWTVATGQGGYYRVYTPYWKAVRGRGVETVAPPPGDLAPPSVWPQSDRLGDWAPGRDMHRGAAVVSRHARIGEDAARERLEAFLENAIIRYSEDRDRLDLAGTSGLSESLAHGEISPRRIWQAVCEEMRRRSGGDAGQAEPFLKELVWREFAYHLLYHTP